MKFILAFLIVLTGSIAEKSSDMVYTKTGHDQFASLEMVDSNNKIIYDMSEDYINQELKELKTKVFGSSSVEFNHFSDCKYVSNTIFSRSNKTREPYTFSYDTSTITYQSVSVTTKGSLSVKGVFKGKSKEITAAGDIQTTNEKEEYTRNTETGRLSVVIYPNKRVTLRIAGECKISNGVKKNFFLGICTKKGAWEVVTVVTTCYELVEEDA